MPLGDTPGGMEVYVNKRGGVAASVYMRTYILFWFFFLFFLVLSCLVTGKGCLIPSSVSAWLLCSGHYLCPTVNSDSCTTHLYICM